MRHVNESFLNEKKSYEPNFWIHYTIELNIKCIGKFLLQMHGKWKTNDVISRNILSKKLSTQEI